MENKLQEMTEEELRKLQDLIPREINRRKCEKAEDYRTRLSALLKEMTNNNTKILLDYGCEILRIKSFCIDDDNNIVADYDEC